MATSVSYPLSSSNQVSHGLKRGSDALQPHPNATSSAKRVHRNPSDDDVTTSPSTNTQNSSLSSRTEQEVLLLHGAKQRYQHVKGQSVPKIKDDLEMLVKVKAIGLNPIDWKAPDFGFGLPSLPCISGRDLAGEVVTAPRSKSRFTTGDLVLGISTDYRDSRKAAYQEYAVVPVFNCARIPPHIQLVSAAPLGVAFVAAVLSLGICLGVDFSKCTVQGPDLLEILRKLQPETLPKDIREECFHGIDLDERPESGDWIAIWGGSSATGCIAVQLAKLAGLKVIALIDVEKNGARMLKHGADILVDRLDTARAIAIIRGITGNKLRFAIDTRGKESAALLASAIQPVESEPEGLSHLVGLTGLPKEGTHGVKYHSVPIKAFHEASEVGEGLMVWLEELLKQDMISTPDIEIAQGGLAGINDALDRLRNGSVNGPRLVVPL